MPIDIHDATVSFIVPCYNQGKYIQVALESIYNQDYNDWEIIVIDDGSTDDSKDVILALKEKAPTRKFYYLNTGDIGMSRARDKAIRIATGRYYIPLDADDRIDRFYVSKTLSKLESSNNKYGFAYVDTLYCVGNNLHSVPSKDYSFVDLLMNNYLSYCSLIKKSAYYDCGGYDLDNFSYFEDYELYIKLGMTGHYGIHIPENLFFYLVHPDSSMNSERTQKLGGVYKAYMINKYPLLFPVEWQNEAKKIMSGFPENFMSWKPNKQEEYAKGL